MAIDTYIPDKGAKRPPLPEEGPSLSRVLCGIAGMEIKRMSTSRKETQEVLFGATAVAFIIAQEAARSLRYRLHSHKKTKSK